jgi:SSS family solute:Na+ symporter
MGDKPMGLNIALGDLDRKETGAGNFGNFHHEDWWAGVKDERTQLRQWGTLWMRTGKRK